MVAEDRLAVAGILLSIAHLSTLWPAESMSCTDLQDSNHITYDDSCSNNCSKQGYSAGGEKMVLDCSIGLPKAFDKFQTENEKDLDKILFEAPTLKSISFFWKPFEYHVKEASLNITFNLPTGIQTPHEESPGAVFMTLQSVQDDRYSDQYYYKCPIKRIFRFSYKPITTDDIKYPWNITFDCFVGLESVKPILVYNLSLHTFKGQKRDYTLTVPIGSWTKETEVWRPVIATQYDTAQETIHVILEKEPDWMSKMECNVSLVNTADGSLQVAKTVPETLGRYSSFMGITHGEYYINVTYSNCLKCNIASYLIETKPYTDSAFLQSEQVQMILVFTVTGCIVVTCICFAAYIFVQRRQNKHKHVTIKNLDVGLTTDIDERNAFIGEPTDDACIAERTEEDHKPRNLCRDKKICSCHKNINNSQHVQNNNNNMDMDIPDVIKCEHNLLNTRDDEMFNPDMFTISIEDKLWESGSDLCCGGRHEPASSNTEKSRSLIDLQDGRGCEEPSLEPRMLNSPRKLPHDTNGFVGALATMRQLNRSNENFY